MWTPVSRATATVAACWALALPTFPSGPAWAQVAEDEDEGGSKSKPTEGVEEVTIIGEVLEISPQAKPTAITSFDQAELDTLGIADVDTLALNTPSLHVGQVGQQAVITLRGVGLENLTGVGETGVGFQVDGVHMGRPSAANGIFFDLERVDVERGPQGTQGGRNTNGGRIALWSRKPEESFEAFGDVQLGNYDELVTRGVINLPIYEDKLLTRASGVFRSRDGYQEQKFAGYRNANADDADDIATRLQARSLWWNQSIDARFIFTHSTQGGRGPAVKLIGKPPTDIDNTTSQLVLNGRLLDFAHVVDCVDENPGGFNPHFCLNRDARETVADSPTDQHNEQNGGTLLLDWSLPQLADTPFQGLRLGFIGSWQQNRQNRLTDFDGTNMPNQLADQERNTKQRSIEAFLVRPDIGLWSFKAGYYYFEESIKDELCFDVGGAANAFDLEFKGDIDTESHAVYAEVGVRPLDTIRVHGGLRYTDEHKSAFQSQTRFTTFLTQTNPRFIGPNDCGNVLRAKIGSRLDNTIIRENFTGTTFIQDKFRATTPMFGIDWQVLGTSSLSLTATRGFKAGGFALGANASLNPELMESFDSEKVWEFELSSKNEIFDGRLRLNATAFWTEYDPFQICQFSGPLFFCRSDGSATVRGLEVEWLAFPLEELQINGHFHFLDARVNNFQIVDPTDRTCRFGEDPPCFGDLPELAVLPALTSDVSGNSLPKAPRWAGSIGIQYALDLGRWGYLIPRFQTQFQDRTYYRVFNKDEFSQDPFIKFDAKLTWRSQNDRFSGELFGVNLTNEDVINSLIVGPQATGGQVLGQYQAPRLFGVRLGITYTSDLVAGLL
jgi:iron complex outermembrane receptor protein